MADSFFNPNAQKTGILWLALFLLFFSAIKLYAGDAAAGNIPAGIDNLKVEGVYYLKYQAGQDYNRFTIGRAYLTAKKKINGFMSSRITLDAHQDDDGDMKVRLKYLYADFRFPEFSFITKPHLEFGLVHRTWLDFEEHINYYRMLDKMYMERAGIFNSADFGFTLQGYFGGEMNKEYQKNVNKKYPGRYGSFAIGIYNGGGYHAEENNQNKSFEARVTGRPVPDIIPGLQISGLLIMGKGNTAGTNNNINDWQTMAAMLSYEHQYMTVTGTVLNGYGDQKGLWSDEDDYQGYSFFVEGKPTRNWRLIGRFDIFDPNKDAASDAFTRIIGGVGYNFGHHNILIADYEVNSYEAGGIDDDNRFQITMQIYY